MICFVLPFKSQAQTKRNLGPVHTNPSSNENGAVLLRFQKDFTDFQSCRFRIVFARPYYNVVSVLKTLLYLQCACSNELDACAFQYIGPRNWREIEAKWQRLSPILDTHGRLVWRSVRSILMTSPFSDSIVFSVHTRKQRFEKASFSNRSILQSVFEWLRFSVIVFGVIVWTIAVSGLSGAKQLRFLLKTDQCGRSLSSYPNIFSFKLLKKNTSPKMCFLCTLKIKTYRKKPPGSSNKWTKFFLQDSHHIGNSVGNFCTTISFKYRLKRKLFLATLNGENKFEVIYETLKRS